MKHYLTPILLAGIVFNSCGTSFPDKVEGYAPVYQTDENVAAITSSDPRPIVSGGKIYVKDFILFQVETREGIHVINIKDPSHPVKICFINLLGISDISIKGNVLYANNYNDLVAVDIADFKNVKLISRQQNVFEMNINQAPPEKGYFECVDPSKGKVVGWKKQTIYSPKCRY
jgi:hypothetical protein